MKAHQRSLLIVLALLVIGGVAAGLTALGQTTEGQPSDPPEASESTYSQYGLECLGDEGVAVQSYGGVNPAGSTPTEAAEAAFELPPVMAATAQERATVASDGEAAEVVYEYEQRRVARVSLDRVSGGWAISGYTSCASAQNTAPGS